MKEYVVGFLFNTARTQVALIRKERPAWQAGMWNGIGGAIELGVDKTPDEAQLREFGEETDMVIDDWDLFAVMRFQKEAVAVFCLRSFAPSIDAIRGKTDELVKVFPVNQLPSNCIPNVFWLLEMARHSTAGPVEINLP